MGRHLRPRSIGIHRFAAAVDDVAVDPILDIGRAVGRAEEALGVGLVLGEEQLRGTVAGKKPIAETGVGGGDRGWSALAERRPRRFRLSPGPGVPEPERGQQMKRRGIGAAVAGRDLDQNILGRGLGIFDEDVEVAILIEDARVQQLVFEFLPAAAAIGVDEVGVGICGLRIFVEIFHVGVGRGRVEVEVIFLHVLAVISLAVRQSEQPLLEDGVLAVPHRQGEAKLLLVVADARQPVLAPVIGARTRLVMGEVVPGIAAVAVVLAHRSPLALAEIRAPFPPGDRAVPGLGQPRLPRPQAGQALLSTTFTLSPVRMILKAQKLKRMVKAGLSRLKKQKPA